MTTRFSSVANRSFGLHRRALAGAVVAAASLAWAIYRPERARSFDILDFSEFLPLVGRASTFADRFSALLGYYASQGRANLIPYAVIAAKWTWFGTWSPGWQLTRAALMLTLIALTFALLRRLGASGLGAALGSSVFLMAPAAADAWVRLTMAEPIGAALVLALALRATRFQGSNRWGRQVALFGAGAAAIVLTKELLAPALLLSVAIALVMRGDGSLGAPELSRRNIVLVMTWLAVSVAVLLPLVMLYARAPTSAFAAQYGSSFQSPGGLAAITIATLVPFEPVPNPASAAWILAIGGFTMLIAAGWRVGFHSRAEGARSRWLLGVSLVFPLIGALAYLPWPAYQSFYALPYLTGTSILIAMAATYLEREARHGTKWALLGWGSAAVYALGGASAKAGRADAVQRAADAVVRIVAGEDAVDSVIMATAQPARQAWQGLGPTLARFASATGRPWPPTRDARCEDAARLVKTATRTIVVVFSSQCTLKNPSGRNVVAPYRRVDWSRWHLVDDSLRADILRGPTSVRHP